MKSEWIARYDSQNIKVINTWLAGEMLYVNDQLQDKRFGSFSSRLTGHLINLQGERKEIKVTISASFSNVDCIVFVDDLVLPLTKIR